MWDVKLFMVMLKITRNLMVKKICVKRKGKSFKELIKSKQIISKNEECKGEFNKTCGIIDTLDRKLCVENNEECPIIKL